MDMYIKMVTINYMPIKREYEITDHSLEAIIRENGIQPTFSSSFSEAVLGLFEPGYKKGRVDQELPSPIQGFVFYHEYAHSHGRDGSPHEEYRADVEAAERTARPEYIRGPFYQPPICLR